VLLILWVGTLQVVLDLGKDATGSIQLDLRDGVMAAIIAWIIWELTEEHPAVDLTLFKGRNFRWGRSASAGLCLFFASNLLMPLWLQTQQGYTATWAGLVAAPAGGGLHALAAGGAGGADRSALAGQLLAGPLASPSDAHRLRLDTDLWHYVCPILVQGAAMGTFFMSMTTSRSTGCPHRIPSATGISNFARITGGAFAASITTTFWDRREILHQSRLAEAANLGNPPIPPRWTS
jgi:DHA2 family multidrug resistance protein